MSDTPANASDSLILAPLRGITLRGFRDVISRVCGGFDEALAPFIPTVSGDTVKSALTKDVAMLEQRGMRIIPQVIGKDPGQLRAMIGALRELGHTEVNLNAGCPWKFIVKKGRGAGLLEDADNLRRMLDAGCAALPCGFSVKVRLGAKSCDTLANRADIINEYPLKRIIMHPRLAVQMYEGSVDIGEFARVLPLFKMPVCYNGDIFSVDDFARLKQRFPSVHQWMIGRGAVTNPFIAADIRLWLAGGGAVARKSGTRANLDAKPTSSAKGEREPCSTSERRRDRGSTIAEDRIAALRQFHDEYYAICKDELFGPASILGRMKEFWKYFAHSPWTDEPAAQERLLRRILRSRQIGEYESIIAQWG